MVLPPWVGSTRSREMDTATGERGKPRSTPWPGCPTTLPPTACRPPHRAAWPPPATPSPHPRLRDRRSVAPVRPPLRWAACARPCVLGCRGTRGNGCPMGKECSSLDNAVGSCMPVGVMPDAGVMMDAGGMAMMPDAGMSAMPDAGRVQDAGATSRGAQ